MADTISTLAGKLRPFWLRDLGATKTAASAGGGTMTTHALAGPLHAGTLDTAQAPWAVTTTDFITHTGNPDAHHATATAGNGITLSGQQVNLTAPGTLTVSSSNAAAGNHTHAITSSSDVSAGGTSILASNAGALTVGTLTGATKVRTPLLDTASGNLALQPAADVTLSPGSNIVRLGTGRLVQSNSFTSGFAGAGWRVDDGVSAAGKTTLEVDNLTVRGLARVYELLISRIRTGNGSYLFSDGGKVASVTGTNPYTLTFDEDHGLAANDLIRAQKFLGTTYTSSCTVDNVPTTKTAVVRLVGGSAPAAGYEYVRIGNSSDTSRRGSVYVTSNDSGAPYLDVIDGIAAHSDWNTAGKVRVRLGQLNGVLGSSLYGLFAGSSGGLWVGVDGTYGHRVVYGSTPRFVVNTSGDLNIYNSAGTATITLDGSGASYFSGPMTIGSSGGIYQGSASGGTFASPSTGLKIWNDSGVGRIAGYNGGTLQWGADTSGKLTAGGGNVTLDATGLNIKMDDTLSNGWNEIKFTSKIDTADYTNLSAYHVVNQGPVASLFAYADDVTEYGKVVIAAYGYGTVNGGQIALNAATTTLSGDLAVNGRFTTTVPVRQHTTDNAWSIDAAGGTTVTAANGAVFQFSDNSTFSGFVVVTNTTDGGTGAFLCGGGVVAKIGDGSNVYTTTKDTASKTNLYYDSGSGEYRMQNNTGGSRTYSIFSVRTRAAS